MLPTHALPISAITIFLCKKKYLRVCALGEDWTREINFGRHEGQIPSHRGRRLYCIKCNRSTPITMPRGRERGTPDLGETPYPFSSVAVKKTNTHCWLCYIHVYQYGHKHTQDFFSERARLAPPWPLRSSRLSTASVYYFAVRERSRFCLLSTLFL